MFCSAGYQLPMQRHHHEDEPAEDRPEHRRDAADHRDQHERQTGERSAQQAEVAHADARGLPHGQERTAEPGDGRREGEHLELRGGEVEAERDAGRRRVLHGLQAATERAVADHGEQQDHEREHDGHGHEERGVVLQPGEPVGGRVAERERQHLLEQRVVAVEVHLDEQGEGHRGEGQVEVAHLQRGQGHERADRGRDHDPAHEADDGPELPHRGRGDAGEGELGQRDLPPVPGEQHERQHDDAERDALAELVDRSTRTPSRTARSRSTTAR